MRQYPACSFLAFGSDGRLPKAELHWGEDGALAIRMMDRSRALAGAPSVAMRALKNTWWQSQHLARTAAVHAVAILMRLLRPFVLVRVGPIRTDRIGHFVGDTESYLSECDVGLHGRRAVNLFFFQSVLVGREGVTSNEQIAAMWRRSILVVPWAELLWKANRRWPGWQTHEISYRSEQARDVRGVLGVTPPHLCFRDEEERRGAQELARVGVDARAPFVCVHARDAAYMQHQFSGYDAGYHSYRDCDIRNYLPAMREITRRGAHVFRMGSVVKNRLDVQDPGIVDYATAGRSDFMDVFLGAKCHFFIACGSGLEAIPQAFRRPLLIVNFIPLEFIYSWDPRYVFIPKKLLLRSEGRLVSFPEILGSEMGRFNSTAQYERAGLEIVENTPEEIVDAVTEMWERLEGTWTPAPEDEALQARFRSLFASSPHHGEFKARIGARFLRRHQNLLDTPR